MRGIALKLWTGMIILVVVMLLLLWAFQVVFLESFYTKLLIERLKDDGLSITREWNSLGKDEIEARFEKLVYSYKAKVDVFDINGGVIYSNGEAPMMMQNQITGAVFARAANGEAIITTIRHPRFNYEFIAIGLPVFSEDVVTGVLIITIPKVPVEETASILKKQLVYITVLLLFTALVLSYYLTRAFTRPILDINNAASQMAAGNLSVRVKPRSKDELGKLSDTMNYLAEQLSRTEQLRKDLIANVSHELRTPLSLIRGYAETIRDVSGNIKEKRDRQLDIIVEEADRLGRIVDDILNLSQLQSGFFKMDISVVDISCLLQKIVKRFEIVSENSGKIVRYEGCETAIARVDEAKIEQVVFNLLNNAINHTTEGDEIIVKLADKDTTVRVEVSDTGEGIPKKDIAYIWDRFYKSDKGCEGKKAGTGLGLSIVKSILEAHKADFGVDSREKEGTTFWFELEKAEPGSSKNLLHKNNRVW